MKKNIVLFAVLFVLAFLPGCGGQTEGVSVTDVPQDTLVESSTAAEPVVESTDVPEPVSEPKPEVVPIPQPQADGTGISFEFPEDWNTNATEGIQNLQSMVNNAGNRVLYGVLHGYMDAQEIISMQLADSSVTPGEFVTGYDLSYDITLNDETRLRLSLTATGFPDESGGDVIFDGIASAYVYPEFANYYWTLECEDMEGWGDWVYQIVEGNTILYYSISADFMADDYSDYGGYDDFSDPGNDAFEEPTRLTQYEWPDYCDETDCLMMESVGLQYNESFGTATKLLTSGSLITISIIPKIGGGAEYGANVRVDNSTTIPVKSSDGINYQCKSTGGQGGNMGGYSGLWITLTKDGWSNWY